MEEPAYAKALCCKKEYRAYPWGGDYYIIWCDCGREHFVHRLHLNAHRQPLKAEVRRQRLQVFGKSRKQQAH